MRIGDSDREQFYEQLKRHAAEGRLDISELERRVEAIAGAATREQAAEVLADLPPLPGAPASGAALPGAPIPGRARWGRGHGDADRVNADWRPTGERFRDPRTHRVMRVWEDGGGARHYVPDEP